MTWKAFHSKADSMFPPSPDLFAAPCPIRPLARPFTSSKDRARKTSCSEKPSRMKGQNVSKSYGQTGKPHVLRETDRSCLHLWFNIGDTLPLPPVPFTGSCSNYKKKYSIHDESLHHPHIHYPLAIQHRYVLLVSFPINSMVKISRVNCEFTRR